MSIVTKESNPELYNALFLEDEIKEILDRLNENKDYDDYVDYKGSYFKPLLDYITNLQESEAYYYGYYKDYKSRCEKSLKALHNSKEYKVMKELEFNKNMSILIKLDKLLGGDE